MHPLEIKLHKNGVIQLFVFIIISTLLLLPSLYLLFTDLLSFKEIAIKVVVFPVTVWIMQHLFCVAACKNFKLAMLMALIFFTFFLVAAWIEAGLIHFTGKEFSPEFFYHFNWESFLIALHTYKWFLIVLLTSILISLATLQRQLKYQKTKNRCINSSLLIHSVLFLFLCLPNTPVWGLCKGAWQYYFTQKVKIQVTSHDKDVLSNLGLHLLTKSKADIQASLPAVPENLILIFLESMNFQFVNNPDFPGLTPFLNRYSNRFTLLQNHISTENVTLPAIISNLCGIVPNFSMGNDTFINNDSMYRNIACSTDILHTAGYYQVYMGGAKSSFAGKGDFLKQHSYDEVIGWEYWQTLDRYKNDDSHSWWGLYDSDLFEEAISKIESLNNQYPFNLTLLTLNTHIPGFSSTKCQGYQKETKNEMLDAIHCSDEAVGNFLDWLDQNGFFENTTIVITGDHSMFRHEITRSILGEKIEDKRIFGLIHSPDDVLPAVIDGRSAAYDMASTIPELLQVSHNITFSAGQSLLEPVDDNRFILDRDNQNHADGCDPSNTILPMAPPFSPCDHRRIMSILDQNISRFSRLDSSIIQKLEQVFIRASQKDGGKASLFMDNMEQLEHISQGGIRQKRSANGIYCVVISPEGKVRQRSFYNVNNTGDMRGFVELLANLRWGEWFFMTHKGDVTGRIPSSAHYLLKNMGWKMALNQTDGYNYIFVTRKGSDPEAAFFKYADSAEDLEVNISFSDLKGLIEHQSPLEQKKDTLTREELLSMMLDDGLITMENDIKICSSDDGDSSVSFFLESVELKKGITFLVFSPFQKLLYNFNYKLHNPDANIEKQLQVLANDTSTLDMTVLIAVSDEEKSYMPEGISQAFKNIGAKKIDDLEINSPYLIIFHTKYGVIYEAVGKSGECIIADSGKIINEVRSFAKKQND